MAEVVENRFAGKVTLVTGAASGVGRATMTRLVAEGASVFAIDINEAGLAEATAGTANVVAGVFDVRSRDACHEAVAAAVDAFGGLDVLANVAGIARAHHVSAVTEDDWRLMMAVNLDGPFWLAQAAIPHLLERDGTIVFVASNAGLMGQAYTAPYSASKGAIVQLTRSLAMEFVKTNLRVNAVAPGGMVTSLTQGFEVPADVDFELMAPYTGFRGMAEPESAAAAICWIASSDAERCNGSILSVDGGLTAG